MKKIIAALFTIALIFSPIGDIAFQDHGTTVEAKSYKSGKKSFNPGNSGVQSNNNNSLFQNKKDSTSVKDSNTKQNNKGGMMSGGLMKGLMLGGLAGLLFGGLLGNMGILGSILGLLVNGLAIIFLFVIALKIYDYFKKKKEANTWRS